MIILTPMFLLTMYRLELRIKFYSRAKLRGALHASLIPSIKLASSLLIRNAHTYTNASQVLAAPTQAILEGGQRQLYMRYSEDATPSVIRVRCWSKRNPAELSTAAMTILQEAI